MAETLEAPVVVAGAGPVGMSTALFLALQGIRVIVVEPRRPGEPPSAKCNTVASRTLETFRLFGVADEVRAAGLPDDYPTDTIYCTSLTGYELTRIKMPSRAERSQKGFPDDNWLTPEPMVRVSQLYLEPILFNRMRQAPEITVINEARVDRFEQNADGVTTHCVRSTGETFIIRSRYLIGCDGGRSTIRKALGFQLIGDAELGRTRSSLVRSNDIRALFGDRRPAWMSWIASDKIRGNVVAINGKDIWLLHRGMPNRETAFEDLDFDQSIRDLLGVGPELTYEVLNHEDWTGRRLVAERFRDRNVFIAGDAAHLWVPFAGYGMNAGIADGVNLAWLLSGVLNGWADPAIIDAFEAERHPITEQVSRLAMGKVLENAEAMGGPPPAILREPGSAGDQVRAIVGARLFEMNLPQMSPEGLNFGYFYDTSPIIAYDGEKAPGYSMGDVTPSTVPGCRMPHFWVGHDSVYDLLGPVYTLLRFNPAREVKGLVESAERAGLPLKVLSLERPKSPTVFKDDLLIVRRDQHIVWRVGSVPADPNDLLKMLAAKKRRPT
ncbi:MAG: FAD-dependent monooxygenase [Alphaproteobacteria bacterium]|nr:FAD-dependent monooxygenase [Alphaproteobacteria bacterium]MBL7097296.1 FAD-dependent monooxygenase [Alphaproteobacteria bacterium]